MITVSPGTAGDCGVTRLKSACVMIPGPMPVWFCVKAAGLDGATGVETVFEFEPPRFTTMFAEVPDMEKGTAMLTCKGETKNSGAGTPFTVTVVPARLVGSGVACAAWVPFANPEPNKATMLPPEIGKVGGA
jgi:hypothetical protein